MTNVIKTSSSERIKKEISTVLSLLSNKLKFIMLKRYSSIRMDTAACMKNLVNCLVLIGLKSEMNYK